ncbi:MAG: shikimate kinase [Candidatus Omnitrophica bacterium]|nr:shikimate kinase [Candidatus Omnitrophota bacterium]
MRNIYLVGFMGTGKTTVGVILAKRLKLEFIEMDSLIEQRQGKSICQIFADLGEEAFRQMENQLLNEISKKSNLVVSCGGGLICDPANSRILKGSGVTFCLKASASLIYQRTKNQTQRPLLKVDNPMKKIEELLAERKPFYESADFIIDTDTMLPEQVAEKIIHILESN